MGEKSKSGFFYAIGIVCVLVFFGTFAWLWSIRETPEGVIAAKRAASQEFRAQKPDDEAAYLRRLAETKKFTVRFSPKFSLGFEPPVSFDFIAQLCEDGFFRCASDLTTPKDVTDRRLKALLAFSEALVACPDVTDEARATLMERRLDGFFLTGDFDGAIGALEKGIPSKSPAWCKGIIAKLRAHKALEAGPSAANRREAAKQFAVFCDYILTDEMKDFEDADPATGVVYSREWVAAKNLMRAASCAADAGDGADAAKYRERAKPLYARAVVKAKGDKVSSDELAKEMKAAGL